MNFEYSEYVGPDGKTLYRPAIPIMFKNGKYYILVRAIIDSGADFTILPIETAKQLDVKLDKKTVFYAAGGNQFSVYKSPIELAYLVRKIGFRSITHKTIVYFAESQTTILLGNHGFLDHLRITLNGPKKRIEIME